MWPKLATPVLQCGRYQLREKPRKGVLVTPQSNTHSFQLPINLRFAWTKVTTKTTLFINKRNILNKSRESQKSKNFAQLTGAHVRTRVSAHATLRSRTPDWLMRWTRARYLKAWRQWRGKRVGGGRGGSSQSIEGRLRWRRERGKGKLRGFGKCTRMF